MSTTLEIMSKEKTELEETTNPPLCVADVIARFSNEHGWISYSEFNKWMIGRGFDVTERERHNRLDGEVHFMYSHKATSKTLDFNGNYWYGKSFGRVVEWINENGL